MKWKRIISSVLVTVLGTSLLFGAGITSAAEAPSAEPVFADLAGHWAKADVEFLVSKGIVDGTENNGQRVILPNATITRAEFVKILVGALNQKSVTAGTYSFQDVPRDHWALPYIEAAKANGITDGYEDGTFRPDSQISRSELAALIVRGYKLKEPAGASVSFADVSSIDWEYPYVKTAASLKLVEGENVNGQTLFQPKRSATRAESITVIARYVRSQEQQKPADDKKPNEPPSTGTTDGGSSSKGTSKVSINLTGDQLAAKLNNGVPISGTDSSGNSVELSGLQISGFTGSTSDLKITPLAQESVFAASKVVVPGITGPVIEFDANGKKFSTATLSLKVTGGANQQNLVAAYYNETTGKFEFLPTQYNAASNTLSFTTSHNSKYVLIDKLAWEQTWRNNLTVTSAVYKKYVDFAFVIDSSGSMMWNDPNDLRKQAVTDMVYTLNSNPQSAVVTETVSVADVLSRSQNYTLYKYDNNGTVTHTVYSNNVYSEADRMAIIDFDYTVVVASTFSSHVPTVTGAVYNIDSSGGTNIFGGLGAAIDLYKTSGNADHRWIIVLLTDGQDNFAEHDWNLIQNAYNQGITIIPMGLSNEVDKEFLQKIATLGGGQYFHVQTANDLQSYFQTVVETSQHTEFIDADQDELDDYYEVTGILLDNGIVLKTSIDPVNGSDTDGDGYTDGEEVGQPVDLIITPDLVPQGSDLVGKTVKVFKNFKSFPTDPNSKPTP